VACSLPHKYQSVPIPVKAASWYHSLRSGAAQAHQARATKGGDLRLLPAECWRSFSLCCWRRFLGGFSGLLWWWGTSCWHSLLLLAIARFRFACDFVQIAWGYRFGNLSSCGFAGVTTLLHPASSPEETLLGFGDLFTSDGTFWFTRQ